MTIQEVIDTILAAIPEAPLEETVDTIKMGNPAQEVTGIVTTFLATTEVIEKAIGLGANLIITHEPIFYLDQAEPTWFEGDPVGETKRRLIAENDLVIWRFHDYWHLHRPDGILHGLLQEVGWDHQTQTDEFDHSQFPVRSFADFMDLVKATCRFEVPSMSLAEVAALFKEKLAIDTVRMVGNPEMTCSRVAVLVGKFAGQTQIEMIGQDEVDVLVCGEINEWETSEYVRDANHTGQVKGLIILGHANSEEAGMKWLVEWLRPRLPGVKITHLPAGDPFRFV